MAKNKLLLKKQRSLKAKKLTELRTRAKQLRAQEDELAQQLAAVEDAIPEDLEQQITEVTDAQTEVNQVPIQGDGAGGRHLDGAGHQLRIYEGNAPGQRPDGGRH